MPQHSFPHKFVSYLPSTLSCAKKSSVERKKQEPAAAVAAAKNQFFAPNLLDGDARLEPPTDCDSDSCELSREVRELRLVSEAEEWRRISTECSVSDIWLRQSGLFWVVF